MYEKRVQFAVDNFIEEQYFLPMAHHYHLKEEKESGKSDLSVSVKHSNFCVYNFDDKKKCGFIRQEKKYGMNKSVDHVVLEERQNGWRLHLIEMKSSVGYRTWLDSIKPKVRTSYLTVLAIAEFLGIKISDVIAYTTYETDKFANDSNKTNPRAMMPALGLPARDPLNDEWDKNQMFLNMGDEIRIIHKKVQMVRNKGTDTLEGSLVIE